MIKRINFIFLLVLFLVSCGEGSLFEETFSFENHSWDIKTKPSFTLDIQDTSKVYNIEFTLRTTTDYQYRNLWVYLTTELPGGKKERNPYQFRISDDAGNWIGNSTGSIVESKLSFLKMKMPLKGKYEFTLEQGNTEQKATEIIDLTLSLKESTKDNTPVEEQK